MARRKTRRNQRNSAAGLSLRERLAAIGAVLGRLLPRASLLLALGILTLLVQRGVQALYAQPVERIVVSGQLESAHREALQATVAARIDAGLLALDLPALRGELQALPWVYRAQLRRRFPGTLEIQVVEQRPIARWGDGGFLNHEARVVTVSDAAQWEALPEIRGPEGSEARLMAQYQRLLEMLRPLELVPTELEEDDFGQLRVALDNGLSLELGNRDFARRIDDFLLLWRSELREQAQHVLRVDMRYADAAAVRFRDTPQLAGLETDG